MDHIEPFDRATNPLRGIDENPAQLKWYVDEHHLGATAERVWNSLKNPPDKDSPNVRRAVLKHLCEQILDDNPDPPLKSQRFLELRGRGLLEMYEDSDTFADLVSLEDWAGVGWPELQRFIALYVESQGDQGPHFSSQAFFGHYLEAHGTPLAS